MKDENSPYWICSKKYWKEQGDFFAARLSEWRGYSCWWSNRRSRAASWDKGEDTEKASRNASFFFSWLSPFIEFKATPHKDCAQVVQSDFSSECTDWVQPILRLANESCVLWRKICKQIVYKGLWPVFVRGCLK